jgi:hypothetical protein
LVEGPHVGVGAGGGHGGEVEDAAHVRPR